MENFYKLKLTSGEIRSFYDGKECGYIKCAPQVVYNKNDFTYQDKTVTFNGYMYVIAVQTSNNMFEDIVLSKKIKYDPKYMAPEDCNISLYEIDVPTEELYNVLQADYLTCFEYETATQQEVVDVIRAAKNYPEFITKYRETFNKLAHKRWIKEELINRRNQMLNDPEIQRREIEEYMQNRKRK